MTHQEAIIHCIKAVLSQSEDVIKSFCRGNPFDKLLRSYDEFNADGLPLYKVERAKNHYKMSIKAFESNLKVEDLHGEHKIPLSIIREQLLESDRALETISNILQSNEVILITKEESKFIDRATKNGGLGLRSTMPDDGRCRLEVADIKIASVTISNHL